MQEAEKQQKGVCDIPLDNFTQHMVIIFYWMRVIAVKCNLLFLF